MSYPTGLSVALSFKKWYNKIITDVINLKNVFRNTKYLLWLYGFYMVRSFVINF